MIINSGRRRKKTGNVFDGGNVPDLDAFETQFGMEEDQQFKAEQHRGRVEDELVMSNNGDSAEVIFRTKKCILSFSLL